MVVEIIPLAFVLGFSLSAMGVALASRLRSMQSFQAIMNFLMMPMFFLSGALFPLNGLPAWMTFLTRIDPASYGVDPLRRVVLSASDVPQRLVEQLGLTLFDRTLAIGVEEAILLAFGLFWLLVAIRNFQVRD